MLVDSHCAYQKHRTPRRFIGPVLRLTTCLTGPSSWDGRQRFYRPLYQTAGEPRDLFLGAGEPRPDRKVDDNTGWEVGQRDDVRI